MINLFMATNTQERTVHIHIIDEWVLTYISLDTMLYRFVFLYHMTKATLIQFKCPIRCNLVMSK